MICVIYVKVLHAFVFVVLNLDNKYTPFADEKTKITS